ncbi:MAG: hypothetical protein ACPGOV_14230 [Magnetovibrionaceae bacterium]
MTGIELNIAEADAEIRTIQLTETGMASVSLQQTDDYHQNAFEEIGLPPDTYTLHNAVKVLGTAADAVLDTDDPDNPEHRARFEEALDDRDVGWVEHGKNVWDAFWDGPSFGLDALEGYAHDLLPEDTEQVDEAPEVGTREEDEGLDRLQSNIDGVALSAEHQLVEAFTADDGQSDVLYKRTEDITEDEIEGVMKSDTYWESNNPDYLASKEKVKAFYDLNYGTDPVERDATGRMIDSGPKRKIPTETSPAKAADRKPLSQALGDFAKSLSKALETATQTDQVKTAQEALNILNNRSQKNGNESPQPMLAVDGQAGPKTRAALKNTLVQNKPSHVQDSVALASFKPTVQKAAQSGTAHALNQATGKSFGGLFSKPQAQQPNATTPTKPKLGSGPTTLGRRAEQSNPLGLGLQIAVNFAAEDHGLFASKAVEPLKEDGIVGPKTEAAFGKVAKEIGSDDMLDRIGQEMGLFG